MPKLGTIVFFLGSPGAGKTKITEALLGVMDDGFNLNKDILAEVITTRKPIFHKYFSHLYLTSEVDEDSLYRALLRSVAYSMRGGKSWSTAIIEGNFGKRLTVGMLQNGLGNLDDYDLCLVHVVCNDIDIQFKRVCERNAPKDKAIVVKGRTYNLTNKKSFQQYHSLRMQEEKNCISTMSTYMRVIEVDNSNPCSSRTLTSLAWDLKRRIERRCSPQITKVSSMPSFITPFEESECFLSFSTKTKCLNSSPEIRPISSSSTSTAQNVSPSKVPLTHFPTPPILELDKKQSRKSSSPFLSLWGHKKQSSESTDVLHTNFSSGRKSPRFSDQFGCQVQHETVSFNVF